MTFRILGSVYHTVYTYRIQVPQDRTNLRGPELHAQVARSRPNSVLEWNVVHLLVQHGVGDAFGETETRVYLVTTQKSAVRSRFDAAPVNSQVELHRRGASHP